MSGFNVQDRPLVVINSRIKDPGNISDSACCDSDPVLDLRQLFASLDLSLFIWK